MDQKEKSCKGEEREREREREKKKKKGKEETDEIGNNRWSEACEAQETGWAT